MNKDTQAYNNKQPDAGRAICNRLANEINACLPKAENKIWHAHPVWFIAGNPVAGYSKQKAGIRLMFWSGVDFDEELLLPGTGKFKDASIIYTEATQIKLKDLRRWLRKSKTIQWDYKNIVKRKGRLVRI